MRASRLAAASAVSALLLAGAAGVAVAAEREDDQVLTVDAAVACGRVTLTAEVHKDFNPDGFDTYEFAVFAGPNAGGAASDPLGQFAVSAEAPVTKTFTLAEDAYGGDGFVSWATISGPNPEFYTRGVVAVATDCTDEEPPADEVPPAEEPPAEEPPANEEPPADEPPADEEPPVDEPPAEEPPADTQPPAPVDDGFTQVSVVPVGGVETGGR